MRFLFVIIISLIHCLSVFSQGFNLQVKHDTEAIPFARLQYGDTKLVANEQGQFRLNSGELKHVEITIWAIGYEEKKITITPEDVLNDSIIEVFLQPVSLFFSDIIVTGNRNEESRKESVIRVSTLNTIQLQSVGALNAADGLSFQPGLRMENNCQNCGFSQLRMNGLGGGYNQFLMNGRPVFSSLNSIYGLEQIPVSWIERIEVIRGGGSVMYGANAIAGTVNLITRDPLFTGGSAQLSLGVMDGRIDQYAGGVAAWVANNNKAGVTISVGQRYREAYDRDGDGFTEIPLLKGLALDLGAFVRPSNSSRLAFQFRVLDEFRRGGDQLDKRPEDTWITEQLESRIYGGEISYETYLKNRNHKLESYVATQHTNMDNYYGAEMDPDGYGLTRDENYVIGFRHQWGKDSLLHKAKKISTVTGTELIRNVLSDAKPGYNVSIFQPVNQYGVFHQIDWQLFPKWKFTLGARVNYDDIVQKPMVTPRAGLKYTVARFSAVRLNYANGYRIPQVFSEDVHAELVSGEVQVIRLAENLTHEQSHGFNMDIDFDFTHKKHEFEFVVNGFYNKLMNVFVLERTEDIFGQTILEKRNGNTATVFGMTYDFSWSWAERVFVQMAFAWQQSTYDTPVEWTEGQFTSSFLRTPDYYGSIIASYALTKSLTLNSSLLCTGPMWLPHYAGYITEDVLERSPLMFDWGLKVNYSFNLKKGTKLNLNVGCKNILDTFQKDLDKGVYRDASYVYGPNRARTFFIGVQIGNIL